MPILGRWHEAKSLIWRDNESPRRPKSAVVKTYPISTAGLVCIDYRRHVPAANPKKEGRQDAYLLGHPYWDIVESKRLGDGRVLQRQVLYLGEINSSQAEAWRKAIEVFDEDAGRPRTLALFAVEPIEAVPADDRVVRVHLSELRLYRPRQWGACWLAGHLWRELELDRFWKERLA